MINQPLMINKIYEGDCLELMKELPNDAVDIVITSPPYNLGKRVKTIAQTYKVNNNDDMNKEEYFKWVHNVITELQRVTKHHIFFNIQEVAGNKGIIAYIFQHFQKDIKETFIWAKTNPPSHINKTQCSNGYEYVFCISKDNPESKTFTHCSFDNHRGDYVKNIFIESVHSNEKQNHNYTFPEWLPRYFITHFSQEGDIVFDPFVGSGTTCYIAKRKNLNYLGFDISKEYVEIAKQRIDDFDIEGLTKWL